MGKTQQATPCEEWMVEAPERLPIDAKSIEPQDPESIMPEARHSNNGFNRKSHKKGKRRHRNEEDEVVERKLKKAKHAQDTAEEIPGVFN